MNRNEHPRITRLDGLRAGAILAVFSTHAFHIRGLWLAVDLFFVLSGFLITGILLDLKHKDLRGYFAHFYERRARRILPPYLLLLLVFSFLFGTAWMRHWYMYAGLTNYLMLLKNSNFDALAPLWSLSVEEQFYFVWPFVLYFVKERKIPAVAICLLILAPILRVLAIPYDTSHQVVYQGMLFRMDDLAMGSLITFVWRAKGDFVRRYGYLGLIPGLLTPLLMVRLAKLGGFSPLDGTVRSNLVTYELALCTVTGIFLWGLGGRFTGLLELKPMQFLGRISYSFYLVHFGVFLLVQEHLHKRLAIAAVAFAVTVTYATLSWYFLEKPILAGGGRRTAAIEASAAASVSGD